MAGWCEIEEGDCGEVIGGWNDATLYRWRGGFALDRTNGEEGRSEKDETGRKGRDGEKAGEIKGG